MERERQTILSLVALGRITPREAERLLAAWNTRREEIWVLTAFVAAGLAQSLPELGRMMHSLLPLHRAVAAIFGWV